MKEKKERQTILFIKVNLCLTLEMAGGLGFEPRLAESESAVLPLDDPPSGPFWEGKEAECDSDGQ